MSRAVADLARIMKTASSLSQSANSVAEVASELSKRLERELPNLTRPRGTVR